MHEVLALEGGLRIEVTSLAACSGTKLPAEGEWENEER